MKINDCSLILITNRTDIECFVKKIAVKRYYTHPHEFAGEELCVNYKFRYELPCHTFHELKNYILRVKDSTGLRSDFRGIIAVYMDEWIGHEEEEYFDVFIKYLSDHQKYKKYIFVIQGKSMNDYYKMIYKIMKYIKVEVKEECISEDNEELAQLIFTSMEKKNIVIDSMVVDWLIKTVYTKYKIDLFNENLRESILNDLAIYTNKDKMTKTSLLEYMDKEKTILGLLGVKEELCIEGKQL